MPIGWLRPMRETAIPVNPYPAVKLSSSRCCTPSTSFTAMRPASPPEIAMARMMVRGMRIPA